MSKRGLLWLFGISLFAMVHAQGRLEWQINADSVENRIDRKLYGFLLEHIYHSVSNGIWGENVWNRSFEERWAYGNWTVNSEGTIELDALSKPAGDFRIGEGKDYELSLEVKRISGEGPVLIGVRDQNRDRMLTNRIYCFLGAENNTEHHLQTATGWVWHTPVVDTKIVDVAKGKLKPGVWVKLRIRCWRDSLTCWLDGRPLFAQQIKKCPSDGRITIGGSACKVAFRNLSVRPLQGSRTVMHPTPFRHWTLVGDGTVSPVYTDVLNDSVSLRIHSDGKMAGIEQTGKFAVSLSDVLEGSLFLRGTVREASVQLVTDGRVVAEKKLEGILAAWKEFSVSLPVSAPDDSASLRIVMHGKGDLYIDQVSLMNHSSASNQGFRKGLTEAVAALHPAALRWPGGSFSEQYRFENGIGRQSGRKGILRWDDFDPLSFGTDEFIAFCRKVGAEPQIVVPIGYHNYDGYVPDCNGTEDWLKRALDWIEYCNGDTTTVWGRKRAMNGHPAPYNVRYWEIDNEVWKMDPVLYAELVRIYSLAMKRKDPRIKIIACGCGRLGREGAGLDSIVIHRTGKYIDYISPHYYQTIQKFDNEGVEEYGKYLDSLAKWIARSSNPDMGIFVSEWNLEGIDMRTGLFAGGFLNRLEKTPKVTMAAGALLLRHISATGWNNAFINFDKDRWFPAPNYVVFKLWSDSFLPLRVSLMGNTGSLNAVATASEDRRTICLKIVNPTSDAVAVHIKCPSEWTSCRWEKVEAGSLETKNSMEHPDSIQVKEQYVSKEGQSVNLSIPPYSASVLCFNR